MLTSVQPPMEAAGREAPTGEKSLTKMLPGLDAWASKSWFPLAVLSAGWGVALFIATFTFWILTLNGQDTGGLAYWLVLSILGGTVTWFALRASMSNRREIPPMLITGLWVASALFGSWLYPLLESNIGIDESVAASVAAFGAVGGTATSVVLYRTRRIVTGQRAVIIGVGWAIAWLVSAWLALSILNLFGGDVPSGIKESLTNLGLSYDTASRLMPWVDALIRGLTGALAGLIGGWVMLGQLKEERSGS